MRLVSLLLPAAAALGVLAPAAAAAPPPNDVPATAAAFEPYSTRVAAPAERQAVAELAEATPETGIAPCLGPTSFARTVWYRIDAAAAPREITVEATGRTLDLVDLAAYVQRAPGAPNDASRANACGGSGVGGADAAEDRTAALSLRVPPGRPVLLQVGRRGERKGADDERVQLTLAETTLAHSAPRGDRADATTPTIGRAGSTFVGLTGATTSEEDLATPRCQALASVWRRFRPRRSGRLTVAATGAEAATLAVFRGTKPSQRGFEGCVDRDGPGPLTLPVDAKARRPLWIRVGTDRPPLGAKSLVRVTSRAAGDRVGGGGCLGNPRSRLSGRLAGPSALRAANAGRFVRLSVRVTRGPVCAARLELVGPGGRVFAVADVPAIRGVQAVALRRTRRLARGRYRLRVQGAGYAGVRMSFPSSLSFRIG